MIEKPLFWIVLAVVIIFFLAKRIRIAKENERFAVHALGKYAGFKGPGLQLKWAGSETEWTRIKADDRGKIISPDMCRVHKVDVPFKSEDQVRIGNYIRLYGFDDDRVLVSLDKDQRGSFICEKCGHQNILS